MAKFHMENCKVNAPNFGNIRNYSDVNFINSEITLTETGPVIEYDEKIIQLELLVELAMKKDLDAFQELAEILKLAKNDETKVTILNQSSYGKKIINACTGLNKSGAIAIANLVVSLWSKT